MNCKAILFPVLHPEVSQARLLILSVSSAINNLISQVWAWGAVTLYLQRVKGVNILNYCKTCYSFRKKCFYNLLAIWQHYGAECEVYSRVLYFYGWRETVQPVCLCGTFHDQQASV